MRRRFARLALAEGLQSLWTQAMTMPREILPRQFYMLTRRCTQRMFLLRPDTATNNAFVYCLAQAAQKSGVDVILPVVLSNHHHTVVYDRSGRIIEFVEHLHKFVAKSQNALRRRNENFWSSDPPSLVRLVDAADVMAKLIYAATNPVKDHLVERVRHWPGVNGLAALLNNKPLTASRPRHFFRSTGHLPRRSTLQLVIPTELGDADTFRRTLRECVAAFEERVAADRLRSGRQIVGRRGVERQSWRQQSTSEEPAVGRMPRVAARSVWSRIEALLRNRAFLAAYRSALVQWRAGLEAVFPVGTYWLRRFANVRIAAPP